MRYILSFLLILVSVNINAQSRLNTEKLKESDLKGLSYDELNLIRNEIYAYKGYIFSNERFQEYFESKNWYKKVKDNSVIELDEIERYNVGLIKKEELLHLDKRRLIVDYFTRLKIALKKEDTNYLHSIFKSSTDSNYKEWVGYMEEVMDKIDVEDINYYKNAGLHKVTVDDGFIQIIYEIRIEGDEVSLLYNYSTMSEIIEDFTVYTDYKSEGEFAHYWKFKIENNKIIYKEWGVAG